MSSTPQMFPGLSLKAPAAWLTHARIICDCSKAVAVPLLPLACAFWLLFLSWRSPAAESSSVAALFRNPPREYSTGPLWVWNDLLNEKQIRETMRDLAGQGVKQVFVHPRPGLMTPYLSPEWFRLWKIALNEAERLDMNVWIYDENSYPSGFAGGLVPDAMPEARGRGLIFSESKTPPTWTNSSVQGLRVFQLTEQQCVEVTDKVRASESLPEGRYLTASIKRAKDNPWNGNHSYVDLLYPGVTEKFLELTHEAYRREVGKYFGKRVPGAFTDEPNLHPAGGLPWTEDLPEVFERRWGYRLLDHVPSLSQPVGDWKKVRHNYWQALNDLFVERWARPYHDYCASHHLEFTGHYWEHDWPKCDAVPDNMAMYAWQHRPGIDCLMNQYREETHAQFGNLRAGRELASVANQLGLKRTLCEVYGAAGWDLRFEDMKRIGDWLLVLGVNTLDQHLSYITIRGARKRDHPQSFSYHEPWWEAYHLSANYLARLSAALSQGNQINSILVLEPTTTAWMYQGDEAKLNELGGSFFNLLQSLESAQIEYDIGSEDLLARHGSVDRGELRIGRRRYKTVVLAPYTENFNRRTLELTREFTDTGGRLLECGIASSMRVEGGLPVGEDVLISLSRHAQSVTPERLPQVLRELPSADRFALSRAPDDKGILFHQRRHLDDGQLLFLVNSSITNSSEGSVECDLHGVEVWNPETGRRQDYPFETLDHGVRTTFKLPPSGSLLLFLSNNQLRSRPAASIVTQAMPSSGPVEVRRLEPNVLTMDYVDVIAGGEAKSNVYCYAANKFAFQKNGLERNPWDSAVQFRDEIISKQFSAGSGFEARYRFRIEEQVPPSLDIVIERPDLYTILCNDQPVMPSKGRWWLDKSFGRIDLTRLARVGENVVTIKASPFTVYHELEPAYILGDFSLKPVENGFIIVPDKGLALGKWNEQGCPFYSAGVAYRQQFQVDELKGSFIVSLPEWYGAVARVTVNNRLAGYVGWPPWECDVTKRIKRGENEVEVAVIGTLKNTLGPHHGKAALGVAWPAVFQSAPDSGPPPGTNYSTVAYGLFELFQLKHLMEQTPRLARHSQADAR